MTTFAFMENVNPYSNADGTPREGMLANFVKWQDEQRRLREMQMSPEERKAYAASQRHLSKKMNS